MEKEIIPEKYKKYSKWVGIISAFLIAAFILYFGYRSMAAETAGQSWRIVALGDSIIGKEREGRRCISVLRNTRECPC